MYLGKNLRTLKVNKAYAYQEKDFPKCIFTVCMYLFINVLHTFLQIQCIQ